MISPKENRSCYVSESQREILLQLITEPTIEEQFFLTGGTALSVFYLHHRVSNDLDLFSLRQVNLSELGFWIRGLWPGESVVIKEAPHFLSCLILETKIDLVIDPLSIDETRPIEFFENGHQLQIDTIQGIVSNKLFTCVSRTEPKDYVDLYAIFKKLPEIRFETVHAMAKKKDAIFDDPPTVAFQLRKELDRRLYKSGHCFEWADIKQDLKALQETVIEDHGKSLAVRTECIGTCGKTFQAVGVAIPATIREL